MTTTHTVVRINRSSVETMRKLDGSGGYPKVVEVRCPASPSISELEAFHVTDSSYYEIARNGDRIRDRGPFWVAFDAQGEPFKISEAEFDSDWEVVPS